MIRLGAFRGPDLSNDPYRLQLQQRLFEYLRRPERQRAQRRIPISEDYFYSSSIHGAVVERCNSKCVFCESPVDKSSDLDHFRPPGQARDLDGEVDREYYAWLAYETDNLILICGECARSKERTFPVRGERAPYIAPLAETRRLERALLIDPYFDRPKRHLEFRADGWCEPLSDMGRVTVALLHLNRKDLLEARQQSVAQMVRVLSGALAFGDGALFLEQLNPREPYAGARLGVFARAARGGPIGGAILSGSAASLPRRLTKLLPKAGELERSRLKERLEAAYSEDSARSRWDGEMPRVAGPSRATSASSSFPRFSREGAHVRRIDLRRFKGVEELRLKVDGPRRSKRARCLMLLGENAVGKSSILQAVALALIGPSQARRLGLEPLDLLRNRKDDRWDQLEPEDADIEVALDSRKRTARLRISGTERRIVDSGEQACLVLGYGTRRYFDPKKLERARGAYSRVQTLFSPTATIPSPATWLNQLPARDFDEVARIIRIVLTLGEEDELVRDMDGRISVRIDRQLVPIQRLSDGYKSILVMVADIVRELLPSFSFLDEAEAVVLIDEVETHLHPRWKMRVMSALRRALPSVQFIVTTHDPLCLRGMEDGEVVVLQRDERGQIVTLDDLPSIKGMRADQLLTSDLFGLSSTIDPETERDVARFVDAVGDLPVGAGSDADELVRHLTVGDDAEEQVIHEALQRFIQERERPTGALRTSVRAEAVQAVLEALKGDQRDVPDA